MFNVDFCVLFCVAVDVWIEENRKMEEITREIMENAQILCRICFGEGRFYIENHQIRFKDEIIDMSEVLAEFSALEIFDTESVPSMICSTCADDLERCYITLRKIRKSDEEIQKIYNIILKETDVNTSSQDDSDFIKSDYGETEETDPRIFCAAECSDENISVIDEIEGHNPEEFQILEIDTLQNTDSNNKEEYILDISNEYIDSEHIEIERQDIQTAPRKSTDLAQALSEILAKVDENTLALEVDRCDDDIMPTNAKKYLLQKSTSRCEAVCSHPNDTERDLLGDCQRGCQYFNIEFLVFTTDIKRVVDISFIEEKCKASCTEAYVQIKRKHACFAGCGRMRKLQEQAPYLNGWIIYMGASDKGMVLIRPEMDISTGNDWIILDSYLKTEDYDYVEMKGTSNVFTFNTNFVNDYLVPFWKWILPVLLLPLVLLTACNVMLGIRNIHKTSSILRNTDELNFKIIVEKLNNKQETEALMSNEKLLNVPSILVEPEYVYFENDYPVKDKEKTMIQE